MRTGGGGTPPADAGPATCSCSGGHPQAPAVSAADTSRPDTTRPDTTRPDTDLVDTDRGSGSSSGQPRRPRCPVPHHPDTGRGARLRQDGGGPAAAVAARRQTAQAGFARLRWSCGQVDAARGERLSGCVDTGRGLPNTGAGTPRHGGHPRPPQAGGAAAAATLDSRQQDRSPPGNGVRPEWDPNVRHRPARPADCQIRSLAPAGSLASSWKGSAGWERRPLR
jgi:hypothetical protein